MKGCEDMSFTAVIFYIVIFAIIVNAKKQENINKGNLTEKAKNNVEKNLVQRQNQGKEKETVSNKAKTGRQMESEQKQAIPNVPRKKERRNISLEPHREEHIQPRIRANNLWGEDKFANQRIVALRLMEGDPVPQGYVVIRCPYCAAENLVTKNCKQHHSCYFCRVPID